MSSKCPSNNYVHAFYASVRKVASGPTFLHFASSTPPDQVVSAMPTLLREFGNKESSATRVKPDPDAEPSQPPLSQGICTKRSRSAAPTASIREVTPGVSLVASARASSMPLTPDPHRINSLAPAANIPHNPGNGLRAGSVGPRRAIRTETTQRLRPGVGAGSVQFSSGTFSSASRVGTPRLPPQPEDFDEPPVLAASSGRITRSLSRTIHNPKPKPGSLSEDPSLLGMDAPVPMDPNDYIRYKKSCQLTDEEKGRNRKGKSAQHELVTAWFEYEAEYPLRHPPDLSGHSKIQHGDVFWYRSPFGIQLWLWTEGEDNGEDFWRPVPLGVCRNIDGRYLGLNPSQKPSWVTETWLGKQKKNSVRVFIFKAT